VTSPIDFVVCRSR